MAQVSNMGPPLSPRETRRSGRRSAPSISASTSKSPDSDQPTREKATSSKAASTSRNKRLKQEDDDVVSEDRKLHTGGQSGSNSGGNNAKTKRKSKDKSLILNDMTENPEATIMDDQVQDPPEEEEEQGITRCVCGSAEDDPDAGEFMVQCETCKVWQHGLCMGYQSEDQVHDDDYYCELCKPEMHTELLRKLAKKSRQTSSTSRQDPATNSRVSRSHSPSHHLKQPSKRRNTMNSRDAAFDESLKEIIEATAAEAAAVQETSLYDISETNDAAKKGKKKTDDDSTAKNRTRSASTVSDGQSGILLPFDRPPSEKASSNVSKHAPGRNRRNRKVVVPDANLNDPEAAVQKVSTKRSGNSSRTKSSSAGKRPPASQSTPLGAMTTSHEHGTRRNQTGNASQQIGTNAVDSRAYRNSHAYVVSQQTLFTSWNLPDYLSHLEQMLPTDIPRPLEVRTGVSISGNPGSRAASIERTMERGVKVKWPAKRTSVGDMNKRVRALVEWVGREQASALDRGRRREALEIALSESGSLLETNDTDILMSSANAPNDGSTFQTIPKPVIEDQVRPETAQEMSARTMKMMEELMQELISFQEKFGPGARNRDRERRPG